MREYRIYTHKLLLSYVLEVNNKYGGNLSVRRDKDTKPLMMIGQDESTFQQYIFSKRQWKSRDGCNLLLPKSGGETIGDTATLYPTMTGIQQWKHFDVLLQAALELAQSLQPVKTNH